MAMTFDDVDGFATSLPGVTVDARWGNRTWMVGGKFFAWQRPFSKADLKRFGDETPPAGEILAVRVENLDVKDALLAIAPPGFFTIPHFQGYAGVLIELRRARAKDVRAAILDAFRAVASTLPRAKPAGSRSPKRRRRTAPRPRANSREQPRAGYTRYAVRPQRGHTAPVGGLSGAAIGPDRALQSSGLKRGDNMSRQISSRVACFTAMALMSCANADPDDRTDTFEAGTATSRYMETSIQTVLMDESRSSTLATLDWDMEATTARFTVDDQTQAVTVSPDLIPSLHSANCAVSSLWNTYVDGSTVDEQTAAPDPASILGCGCHWDRDACGGHGAVMCCCWWYDLCSAACY